MDFWPCPQATQQAPPLASLWEVWPSLYRVATTGGKNLASISGKKKGFVMLPRGGQDRGVPLEKEKEHTYRGPQVDALIRQLAQLTQPAARCWWW